MNIWLITIKEESYKKIQSRQQKQNKPIKIEQKPNQVPRVTDGEIQYRKNLDFKQNHDRNQQKPNQIHWQARKEILHIVQIHIK